MIITALLHNTTQETMKNMEYDGYFISMMCHFACPSPNVFVHQHPIRGGIDKAHKGVELKLRPSFFPPGA